MISRTPWLRSTFIFFAALVLSVTATNAQPPQRLISKLDARLSSSIRAGHSDTRRVIIRTTSNGIPRLTDALKGNRRFVRRLHATINALTAHVPVQSSKASRDFPSSNRSRRTRSSKRNKRPGEDRRSRNARSARPDSRGLWRASSHHRFWSGGRPGVRRPHRRLLRLHESRESRRCRQTRTAMALMSRD